MSHANTPHTSIPHAHPFTTPRKPPHTHIPSPLSLSSTPDTDTVTNPDRAKPPEIQRVLSPLRARRTPVLVKAPDVRWRLGVSPGVRGGSLDMGTSLRSVGSVELFVSSGEVVGGENNGREGEREGKRRREGGSRGERGRKSGSEVAETSTSASTNGAAPRDTPLPLSRAGPGASVSSNAGSTTTTASELPVSIPLPPLPPALQRTPVGRDNVDGARPTRIADGKGKDEDKEQKIDDRTTSTHPPHPLSPIQEASPPPSLHSSATALDSSIDRPRNGSTHVRARKIGTSDSRTPRHKPAQHDSLRMNGLSLPPRHRQRDPAISADDNRQDDHVPHPLHSDESSDGNNDNDTEKENGNEEKPTPTPPTGNHAAKFRPRRLCRKLAKFKKSVRRVGHRAVEGVARKVVARVLKRVL